MKILLLGEYSNVHNTLAEGLRALGHEVCVASNGDFWKNYPRDIDLKRDMTLWGKLSFAWRLVKALPRMRGYDVVQLINPIFVELKAHQNLRFYRYLRRHNKKVVMASYGMDYYWVKVNSDDCPLRYSDFNIGNNVRHDEAAERERRDWIGTDKQALNEFIAHDSDAIVSGLYEYWVTYQQFGDKMRFIPFPIKVPEVGKYMAETTADAIATPAKLRIFVGISKARSAYKGTDIMLAAAQKLQADYPDKVELQVAEGVPFAQYQQMMDSSDCILDQLYSYTPAMNALLAMSKGIIVVGGGEEENYTILDKEYTERPIVNVVPVVDDATGEVDFDRSVANCYAALEALVTHPERKSVMKRQSREYVKRFHDYRTVAMEYVKLYEKILSK